MRRMEHYFPVRWTNQSQIIRFQLQVSRENTSSNGGLFYLCLLALGLFDDSEVEIDDVLGEGDFYRKNLKGVRDYIYGTSLFSWRVQESLSNDEKKKLEFRFPGSEKLGPSRNSRMERNFPVISIFRNFRPTSRGTPKACS